jgi:hypothetical protein
MLPNFAEQSEAICAGEITEPARRDSLERRVFRASIVVLGTFSAAYVLWQLVDLPLLLFACALVSLILLTITNMLRLRTRLPFGVALALTVLGLLALKRTKRRCRLLHSSTHHRVSNATDRCNEAPYLGLKPVRWLRRGGVPDPLWPGS